MIAFCNILESMKHTINPKIQVTPLMVRVRPSSKEILRNAALAQRRSMAAIVDDLIIDHLGRQYSSANTRLQSFLRTGNE
jgi:predicted HicB family RNase H-like nuclease